jgi:putative FmdB family regulatory protein
MPIYAYHCEDCQEPFELFVRSVSTPVAAVCPKCGSAHVEKEVTAFSAVGGGSTSFSATTACAPSG